MLYTNQKLYEGIKEMGVVPVKRLEELYEEAEVRKVQLSDLLLKHDLISDENLGRFVSDMLGLKFVRLSGISIPDETFRIVPELVARKQRIIAFKEDKNGLHLA